MLKGAVGQELREYSKDVLFLFLEPQLGRDSNGQEELASLRTELM